MRYTTWTILTIPPARDFQEDLHIAKGEIARAQEIITNLLEFSREGGTDMEEVDLDDLLGKTLQLLRKYLETHQIQVTTRLGDVGRCLTNQKCVAPSLSEPHHQCGPGPCLRGASCACRRDGNAHNHISIEVSDTGVGIPEHQLNSIFNPFFTTKEPGQGTGLGLSIVHSVIKRYQGSICRAQRREPGDDLFSLSFPARARMKPLGWKCPRLPSPRPSVS